MRGERVLPERQDRSKLIGEFFSRSLKKREIAFMYLGYAGIILRVEDRAVAFDVADLLGDKEIDAFSKLDLLVFTHSHRDHYNRARALKILETTDARVVAQAQVADDLKGNAPVERVTAADSSRTMRVGSFEIDAVEGIHPKPISVYRIKISMFNVFHGGDSGYSPVKDYPANLAFLPTGRPSPSCSPESALKFANDLKPAVAVAMHGSPAQLDRFKELVEQELSDTEVIIPKQFKIETVII